MAKKDYYDVLGVEKNCDDKSLKVPSESSQRIPP